MDHPFEDVPAAAFRQLHRFHLGQLVLAGGVERGELRFERQTTVRNDTEPAPLRIRNVEHTQKHVPCAFVAAGLDDP
ncbi:MAG: hypothetical protein R6V12_20085, partial [Candidatus Hydrogenedentota bacterium]